MKSENIWAVRPGLLLAFLTLLFGIGMGIVFGVNEDGVKQWINSGIATHPAVHDEKSATKIWRYAQRAHFHATGIGAFTIGLILLIALVDMKARLKTISAVLVGLGGSYSLSWLMMFLLAPSMGRDAAHHALWTEVFVYVGVGGLLAGISLLILNLFFGVGTPTSTVTADTKPSDSVNTTYAVEGS